MPGDDGSLYVGGLGLIPPKTWSPIVRFQITGTNAARFHFDDNLPRPRFRRVHLFQPIVTWRVSDHCFHLFGKFARKFRFYAHVNPSIQLFSSGVPWT